MSGSLAKVKCQDCSASLTPMVTLTNRNGKQGGFFVSCSGTEQTPHRAYFRFIEDSLQSLPSPQTLPYQDVYPQPTIAASQQPLEQGRCAVPVCAKRRVNIKCPHRACATHCRASGGCAIHPSGSSTIPGPNALPQTSLATFPIITPTFSPLRMSPPLAADLLPSTRLAIPSSVETEALLSTVPPSLAPLLKVPANMPFRAEPPSSMTPLPDPRFASQMRPIFTTQASREQEMREEARAMEERRLDGTKKVKHTVTVCAWLSDDDGPEESIHQGGFVWPNFCLSSSVLSDAGFHNVNKDIWYHLYNRSRLSWQRVKPNHYLSVDTTSEILVKAVDVKTCARLEEYLSYGPKADVPNFRTDLRRERASVQAKEDCEFLESNPSTPFRSKHKLKRVHTPQWLSSPSAHPQSTSSASKTGSATSSLLSPSSSVVDVTDSDSEASWQPPKRRKLISLKQEQSTSSDVSTVQERQWPSDYPVLDVLDVLFACKPPPPGTTVRQRFHSLTGIPFKSTTYYDAWAKWDNATQQQRDDAQASDDTDVWEDFAGQVSLERTRLKVARQRLRRRQH